MISCGAFTKNANSVTIDSSYTIVHASDVNDAEAEIYEKFYELMADRCEGIEVKDDLSEKEDDICEAEILIGEVDRTESEEVEITSAEKYTIMVVGDKLVIKAGSTVALDAACLYFRERIDTEGLTLPGDYEYHGEVISSEDFIRFVHLFQITCIDRCRRWY